MPAFTFEKISSREQRGSRSSKPKEQGQQAGNPPERRGVIQVLGRFVEARVRPMTSSDRSSIRDE